MVWIREGLGFLFVYLRKRDEVFSSALSALAEIFQEVVFPVVSNGPETRNLYLKESLAFKVEEVGVQTTVLEDFV